MAVPAPAGTARLEWAVTAGPEFTGSARTAPGAEGGAASGGGRTAVAGQCRGRDGDCAHGDGGDDYAPVVLLLAVRAHALTSLGVGDRHSWDGSAKGAKGPWYYLTSYFRETLAKANAGVLPPAPTVSVFLAPRQGTLD